MRGVEHAPRMGEKRSEHRDLAKKLEGESALGKP
jgi:hypothetical protein